MSFTGMGYGLCGKLFQLKSMGRHTVNRSLKLPRILHVKCKIAVVCEYISFTSFSQLWMVEPLTFITGSTLSGADFPPTPCRMPSPGGPVKFLKVFIDK